MSPAYSYEQDRQTDTRRFRHRTSSTRSGSLSVE